MKKFTLPTLSIISFAAALSLSVSTNAAAPYCEDVIFNLEYAPNLQKVKTDLQEQIRSKQIPARITRGQQNNIPVVLLNDHTAIQLSPYILKSMGTQVVYQPEWRNDHGLVRFQNVIADMDAPGARRFGELHATGIQWKELYKYVELRSEPGRGRQVLMEVSYALNRSESEVASIYPTMRRSAIVRVPFTFGGRQGNLEQQNMLKNSGEHCFIFCSGSGIGGQIREIADNYQQMKLGDIEVILKDAEVEAFLDKVDLILIGSQRSNQEKYMIPEIAKYIKGYPELTQRIFKDLTEVQKIEAMNWIIAYRASKNYQSLLKNLKISGDTGYRDMANPRATALLIYDNGVTGEQFTSPDYRAEGKFSSWTHQNTDAL